MARIPIVEILLNGEKVIINETAYDPSTHTLWEDRTSRKKKDAKPPKKTESEVRAAFSNNGATGDAAPSALNNSQPSKDAPVEKPPVAENEKPETESEPAPVAEKPEVEETKASEKEKPSFDERMESAVIEMLDEDPEQENEDWWTLEKLPEVRELNRRLGERVKASQRNAIFKKIVGEGSS